MSGRINRWIVVLGTLLIPTTLASPAFAQVCTGSNIGFIAGSGTDSRSANCVGLFYCYQPELLAVRYETVGGCDPEAATCSVRAVVPGKFPSASKDTLAIGYSDSPVKLTFTNSSGGFVGSCGNMGARIQVDEGDTYIQAGGFSCSDPGAMTGADTYTLKAVVCHGVSGCEKQATTTVPLTPSAAAAALCAPPPPPMNCDAGDSSCAVCLNGGDRVPRVLAAAGLESGHPAPALGLSWSTRRRAPGNVEAFWRGADSPTDAGAVDVWQLTYDDPALPSETTVTDPLGNSSIYTFDRDASFKPRLGSLSDSCPVCGVGPNSQLAYEDAANPMRPTQEIDGNGTVTRFAYDSHGQVTSRIEDFGGGLERETVWDYHPTFPLFVTAVRRPSVTGNPLDERITSILYDASGNETNWTLSGFEDGTPFNLETVSVPNSAGRVLSIDPPGYDTDDVSSFTYDPARGDLVPDTRTDPLIGTTTYGHDAYNRLTTVTDPNGTIVQTQYDNLDRLRFMTRCGTVCGDADDFITEYVYDVFGDLYQTILPRGNVIEYAYNPAGRLETVERKPDALPASHGERTVYGYDGFGHRVREELQR